MQNATLRINTLRGLLLLALVEAERVDCWLISRCTISFGAVVWFAVVETLGGGLVNVDVRSRSVDREGVHDDFWRGLRAELRQIAVGATGTLTGRRTAVTTGIVDGKNLRVLVQA